MEAKPQARSSNKQSRQGKSSRRPENVADLGKTSTRELSNHGPDHDGARSAYVGVLREIAVFPPEIRATTGREPNLVNYLPTGSLSMGQCAGE
ncbi:hypothetical protein VM1G_08439 [Cytospora mali]|uniref:Uncharacterized protein n=1 Tax=Cytospora mali TaxID=578113 RepID=A0A194W8K6_CYTMA|nr:hypothetical protein VM1G_08439 [Valsa mali]